MDYLLIDRQKLKITMTAEDLLFYGMELKHISYSSTETRRAFWAILDDAKHATGFDAAASKVSVQIYTSRDGGCEMYILSCSPEAEAPSETLSLWKAAEDSPSPLHGECAVEKGATGLTVCTPAPLTATLTAATFAELSHLLSACHALSAAGYQGDSSAWQMDGRYYLQLSADRSGSTCLIAEFGTPMKADGLCCLAEHGNCICEQNAVERLAAMAI